MRFLHSRFFMLAAFAAVIMFSGLNFRELFSGDETRVAGIIAEMTISGDHVTPKLNGRPFLEYPPLYYQCGSLSFRLFGSTDAAAKLPSALCAFGAALLVFALARRLKLSKDAALAAGVIYLTGAQTFGNGRKCMVDMMLAFFVLLAIYAYHSLDGAKSRRSKAAFFLLYSAALAGGFMTKGPIGFAFPWFGLGIWLIADDLCFEKRFTFRRYLLLGLGVVPALIPILYWLRRLYLAGGREYLRIVLVENCLHRFTGAQGDHVKPFWFYFTKLPEMFQPWLIVFFAALIYAGYLASKRRLDRKIVPLLCESIVPFVMLSCSAAKRQVYLLPIFSTWAVLTAWFLIDNRRIWADRLKRFAPWIVRYWRPAAAAVAAVVLIVFAVIAPRWAKAIPAAALVLLAAAIFQAKARALPALLCAALLFAGIDAAVIAKGSRRKSLRPLFAECLRLERKGCFITLGAPAAERTQGAAVFYLGKTVPMRNGGAPLEAREMRIVRGGNTGRKFADGHRLLGPVETP